MTQIREPFSVAVLNEYVTLHSSNDTNYRIMLIEMGLFLVGRECVRPCVCSVSYIGNCNIAIQLLFRRIKKAAVALRAIILVHSPQAKDAASGIK